MRELDLLLQVGPDLGQHPLSGAYPLPGLDESFDHSSSLPWGGSLPSPHPRPPAPLFSPF